MLRFKIKVTSQWFKIKKQKGNKEMGMMITYPSSEVDLCQRER